MPKYLFTVKKVDFRPVDFDSGKRLALPEYEMQECTCCNKKLSKGAILNNGALVGHECETVLTSLHSYPAEVLKATKKQIAYHQVATKAAA